MRTRATEGDFAGVRPQALLCGPLLLAGLTHGPRNLHADPAELARWLAPVPRGAAAQLRSLRTAAGGVLAMTPSGVKVAAPDSWADELPPPTAHDAADVTWRLLPLGTEADGAELLALEAFAQPGAFLGAAAPPPGDEPPPVALVEAAESGCGEGACARSAAGEPVPWRAVFRKLRDEATARDGAARVTWLLEAVGVVGALLCASDDGRLALRPWAAEARGGRLGAAQRAACVLELTRGAAEYAPLSMWARPRTGRGFLFVPLKDIVDQVLPLTLILTAWTLTLSLTPIRCTACTSTSARTRRSCRASAG